MDDWFDKQTLIGLQYSVPLDHAASQMEDVAMKGVSEHIALLALLLGTGGTVWSIPSQARAGPTTDQRFLAPSAEPTNYEVVHVVDGDTVVLKVDGQTTTVRLANIAADAKKQGTQALRTLLKGQQVRFETVAGSTNDKSGHPFVRLFQVSDGSSVNEAVGKAVAAQNAATADKAGARAQAKDAVADAAEEHRPRRRRPLRQLRDNPALNRSFDVPQGLFADFRQNLGNQLQNAGLQNPGLGNLAWGNQNGAIGAQPNLGAAWMMPGFGFGVPGLAFTGFGGGLPWWSPPPMSFGFGGVVAYAYNPGFYGFFGGYPTNSTYANNNNFNNNNHNNQFNPNPNMIPQGSFRIPAHPAFTPQQHLASFNHQMGLSGGIPWTNHLPLSFQAGVNSHASLLPWTNGLHQGVPGSTGTPHSYLAHAMGSGQMYGGHPVHMGAALFPNHLAGFGTHMGGLGGPHMGGMGGMHSGGGHGGGGGAH